MVTPGTVAITDNIEQFLIYRQECDNYNYTAGMTVIR